MKIEALNFAQACDDSDVEYLTRFIKHNHPLDFSEDEWDEMFSHYFHSTISGPFDDEIFEWFYPDD